MISNEAKDALKSVVDTVKSTIEGVKTELSDRMDKIEEKYAGVKRAEVFGAETKQSGPFIQVKKATRPAAEVKMGEIISYLANGRGLDPNVAQKAIGTAPNSSGGYFLAPAISSQVVEEVLEDSVCMKAGARLFPYNSPSVVIPTVVSTSQTSYWKTENEESDENTITFGGITQTPNTVMALVYASRESLEDSALLEDTIVAALYKRLANEVDRVMLRGSGVAPEPKGLRFADNVPVAALSAAPVSNTVLAGAVYDVRNAGFEPNGIVLSHRDHKKYMTEVSSADDQPLGTLPYLQGIPVYGTSQIPTNIEIGSPAVQNTSEIYVGDWSKLILGVRSDLQLDVSPYSGDTFAKNQVAIRLVGRFSVGVLNPTAFAVKTTVTAS